MDERTKNKRLFALYLLYCKEYQLDQNNYNNLKRFIDIIKK